ncbi:MAG: LuxR C-terminal-related transcriptional regulator [Vulcanimicrobiaceae bacterium]
MIRPVAADGRIDAGGAFTPILRPRIVDRIATAASQRVVLVVAPAGYGKSVALRQYLDTTGEAYVRYDLHAEHANLLGFVRGFADALLEIAPDARKTVSGAYEKSRSSRTPGADLAMWMHAHIKTFSGLLAIDDLHVAENDPEITKFLVSLIERTKGRARWIIASRSSLDLPVASWLAYGEMDLTIDEEDLKFTVDEARLTAKASRVGVRDEELNEILAMTEGWPTALSFALRTSTRSIDLRNIAATTREMVYRYLAEQVYLSLTDEERDFLHFAANLQEIDLDVLRAAGYEKGKAVVEALRDRVAFIYADRPGVYRCHDLFRDFLLHQLELEGDVAVRARQLQVAKALEAAGRTPAALTLYGRAGATRDLLRILEAQGFELMEQAHGDAVGTAIESLPSDLRATNAIVLGMRALAEADSGRLDRAESLFERALTKPLPASTLANLAIRCALLKINQGKSPGALLEPLVSDSVAASLRGEALSLLALSAAMSGDSLHAAEYIDAAQGLLADVESEPSRAKIYQRVGGALYLIGRPDESRHFEAHAAEMALECGLLSLASRANGVLAHIAWDEEDGAARVLWYAQQSSIAAAKSGDRLSMQNALLHMLNVESRRGNWERVKALHKQLASATTSDLRHNAAIAESNALQAAAEGRFGEAHRLLAPVYDRPAYEKDRILNGGLLAVYALMSGHREDAVQAVTDTLGRADACGLQTYGTRLNIDLAIGLCAFVEALAGRVTAANKLLSRKNLWRSAASDAFRQTVSGYVRSLKSPIPDDELCENLESAIGQGLGGFVRVVEMAWRHHQERQEPDSDIVLTRSEQKILQSLAEGMSPKQIAAETGRSVYTIQAHIQNAITKLGCSGRTEALQQARKRGLLT